VYTLLYVVIVLLYSLVSSLPTIYLPLSLSLS
jgi:hypothetical protein